MCLISMKIHSYLVTLYWKICDVAQVHTKGWVQEGGCASFHAKHQAEDNSILWIKLSKTADYETHFHSNFLRVGV